MTFSILYSSSTQTESAFEIICLETPIYITAHPYTHIHGQKHTYKHIRKCLSIKHKEKVYIFMCRKCEKIQNKYLVSPHTSSCHVLRRTSIIICIYKNVHIHASMYLIYLATQFLQPKVGPKSITIMSNLRKFYLLSKLKSF